MRTLLILALITCCGCTSLGKLTPADQKRFEDEFRRMHENPIPPGVIIPPVPRH